LWSLLASLKVAHLKSKAVVDAFCQRYFAEGSSYTTVFLPCDGNFWLRSRRRYKMENFSSRKQQQQHFYVTNDGKLCAKHAPNTHKGRIEEGRIIFCSSTRKHKSFT